MRPIVFLVGFIFVTVPYAEYLANIDTEPTGALASLLIFGTAGAILSSMAYWFAGELLSRRPGKCAALFTGALCSTVFFASMGLIYVGVAFFTSLSVAAAVLLLVASSAPHFTAKA